MPESREKTVTSLRRTSNSFAEALKIKQVKHSV